MPFNYCIGECKKNAHSKNYSTKLKVTLVTEIGFLIATALLIHDSVLECTTQTYTEIKTNSQHSQKMGHQTSSR